MALDAIGEGNPARPGAPQESFAQKIFNRVARSRKLAAFALSGTLMLSFTQAAGAQDTSASLHDFFCSSPLSLHDGPYVPPECETIKPAVSAQEISPVSLHDGPYVPPEEINDKAEAVAPAPKMTAPVVTTPQKKPAAMPEKQAMKPEAAVAERPVSVVSVRPKISRIPDDVFREASKLTGVNEDYLRRLMHAESSGNLKAKAKTSTAKGAYQFLDSTWLMVLKKYGPLYGYKNAADAIVLDNRVLHGRYYIPNAKNRNYIMNVLRYNPRCSTIMAAAFSKENHEMLKSEVSGISPDTQTELYIAHVFGINGAIQFIKSHFFNPHQNSCRILPNAADSNRSIFYRDGHCSELNQVYRVMSKKMPPNSLKPPKPPKRHVAGNSTKRV